MAYRPDEFRAFFAYHDALMDKDGGLTKAEREMIVVATSSANQCQYCVIAHGAILRIRAKNPLIADQIAVNYRKADITPRQRAMLDFAMKVSDRGAQDFGSGFRRACGHGFGDDDIWDIAAIAAFFALSNRMANVTGDAPERRILPDGAAAEITKRFQAKWIPVREKKTRQIRNRQLPRASRPTPVRTSRADRSRPCFSPAPALFSMAFSKLASTLLRDI